MNLKISTKVFFVIIFSWQNSQAQLSSQLHDRLFTAGYAHAFIGGLYDGYYPCHKLKQNGDFGLGAPDKLDGELLMLNGKIYQTQSTGKTFEVSDKALIPYAVVNFFKADRVLALKKPISRQSLYAFLDSVLNDVNGIYAIHLKGKFTTAKTRAFPAVITKPYQPLADMLALQRFFNFETTSGDLVGYRLPGYMDGANITGYHFHFLSEDKKSGGHIIDFIAENLVIEIDQLYSFAVDLPKTADFKNYDFTKNRHEELKSVENGKKD
ncbi:MAG: acetolactate decarboxylase [Sphingobacteriaceae bacterium]|nr:acetolactate decarboxylase [Sphingobacteriaceae bacterium]